MNEVWFSTKRVGYGLRPSSWEGWATMLAFVALLVAAWHFLRPAQTGSWVAFGIAALCLVAILAFVMVSRSSSS